MSVLMLDRVTKSTHPKKNGSRQVADGDGLPYAVTARGSGDTRVLAYVERDCAPEQVDAYVNARKQGMRSFAVWTDRYRSHRLASVRTEPGHTARRAVYLVHGAAGELIGTVTVEKASVFPPRRTLWTIRPGNEPPAVAKKGRVIWWWVWFLFLPLMVVTVVLSVFASSGDGLTSGTPKRTIWRRNGKMVLDYRSAGTYHVPGQSLDTRLAIALVALHRSHQEGLLADDAWDVRA